jgi:hypothetical protein
MATNQTKMKGIDIHDGAIMIFELSPYHFVMGNLDKTIEDKNVWIHGFAKNLRQIIPYLSTPIVRS